MPRKKTQKIASKKTKEIKTEEPKVESFANEVIITFAYGKSKVIIKTTVDRFKQDCLTIWEKAMADLDELNAQT